MGAYFRRDKDQMAKDLADVLRRFPRLAEHRHLGKDMAALRHVGHPHGDDPVGLGGQQFLPLQEDAACPSFSSSTT